MINVAVLVGSHPKSADAAQAVLKAMKNEPSPVKLDFDGVEETSGLFMDLLSRYNFLFCNANSNVRRAILRNSVMKLAQDKKFIAGLRQMFETE